MEMKPNIQHRGSDSVPNSVHLLPIQMSDPCFCQDHVNSGPPSQIGSAVGTSPGSPTREQRRTTNSLPPIQSPKSLPSQTPRIPPIGSPPIVPKLKLESNRSHNSPSVFDYSPSSISPEKQQNLNPPPLPLEDDVPKLSINIGAIKTKEEQKEKTPLSNVGGSTTHKKDYLKLQFLGRGASGMVYKAVHIPSLTIAAVKIVEIAEEEKRKQLITELNTLYYNYFIL